jgi:hypothetical protein
MPPGRGQCLDLSEVEGCRGGSHRDPTCRALYPLGMRADVPSARTVDLYESIPGATLKGIAEDLGIGREALANWARRSAPGRRPPDHPSGRPETRPRGWPGSRPYARRQEPRDPPRFHTPSGLCEPASWSVTVSAYWRASASAGGTRRRRTRLFKEDPSTEPGARALSVLPYSDQDRRSSRCRIIDGFSPNMSVLMSCSRAASVACLPSASMWPVRRSRVKPAA